MLRSIKRAVEQAEEVGKRQPPGGRQSNLDLNKLDEDDSFQTEKIQPKLREKRNLNLLSESELQKHNEFISKFISDAMWNKKEENQCF